MSLLDLCIIMSAIYSNRFCTERFSTTVSGLWLAFGALAALFEVAKWMFR